MRVGELRWRRRRRRSDGVARERLVVVVVGGLSRLFARRVSSRRRRYSEAVVVDRTTPVVEQLLCDTADIECIYRMGMRWFQLLFRYVVYDTTYDDGTDFIYFVFFLSTPSLVAYIIYRPERYLPVDLPPPPLLSRSTLFFRTDPSGVTPIDAHLYMESDAASTHGIDIRIDIPGLPAGIRGHMERHSIETRMATTTNSSHR